MDTDFANTASFDVNNLPSVYAEVDNDNNFTRIYLEGTLTSGSDVYDDEEYDDEDEYSTVLDSEEAVDEEGTVTTYDEEEIDEEEEYAPSTMSIMVDLKFTYPGTINIAEPDSYTDLNGLEQVLGPLFSGSLGGEVIVDES